MAALKIDSAANVPEQQAVLGGSSAAGLSPVQVASQLLPHAADLAALMQQYYALPAVEAETQLALAQAAARRSCAYLRCANLGGEGGPAAGQGAGSMRCRSVGGGSWGAVECGRRLVAPLDVLL